MIRSTTSSSAQSDAGFQQSDWKKHIQALKSKNKESHSSRSSLVNKVSPEQMEETKLKSDVSVSVSQNSYSMEFDNSAIHGNNNDESGLALDNVAMNLRFDESSIIDSTINTPPRPPQETLDKKPVMSDHSPTCHQQLRSTTVAASVLPAQVMMADKSNIKISPTRLKDESEFGKSLEECARVERGESATATQPQNCSITEVNESSNEVEVIDEWKEALTSDGKIYYYNRRTRKSTWRLPPDAKLYEPPIENEENMNRQENTKVVGETASLFCLYCGVKDDALNVAEHMKSCHQAASQVYSGENRLKALKIIQRCVLEHQQEGETIYNDMKADEQCNICSRTFSSKRSLTLHMKACKAQDQRTVPFDSRQKRMNGTAMQQFAASSPEPKTPDSRPTSAVRSKKNIGRSIGSPTHLSATR